MPSPEVVEKSLQNVGLAVVVGWQIINEIRIRELKKDMREVQEQIGDAKEKVHLHPDVVGEEAASVEPDAEETVSPEWEVPVGQILPEPAPA